MAEAVGEGVAAREAAESVGAAEAVGEGVAAKEAAESVGAAEAADEGVAAREATESVGAVEADGAGVVARAAMSPEVEADCLNQRPLEALNVRGVAREEGSRGKEVTQKIELAAGEADLANRALSEREAYAGEAACQA